MRGQPASRLLAFTFLPMFRLSAAARPRSAGLLHAWTDCLGDGRFSPLLLSRHCPQQILADPADDQLPRSRWVTVAGARIAGSISYQGMQKTQ
jgi:hypothetical protein